jgi:hypothetical protein
MKYGGSSGIINSAETGIMAISTENVVKENEMA